METIFMKTESSKTNEPDRFRLILADKLNPKDPNKHMVLGNSSIYYTWKDIKSSYKKCMICMMDHFSFQIYQIILKTSLKK